MSDITLVRTVQHGPFLSGRKTRIHTTHSRDPGLAYIYTGGAKRCINILRDICVNVYTFLAPLHIYIYIYRRSSTCLQGKALPVNAMKECERSEYIALFILHLGTGLSPVSRPRPLNKRGQISLYPLNWRRGGPHNRTTRFGENINPLSLLKFEPRIVYPAA